MCVYVYIYIGAPFCWKNKRIIAEYFAGYVCSTENSFSYLMTM